MCRFVVVQSVGKKTSGEEECSDNESLQHASSGSEGSFSDSEEEEENRGIVTGIEFDCFGLIVCSVSCTSNLKASVLGKS